MIPQILKAISLYFNIKIVNIEDSLCRATYCSSKPGKYPILYLIQENGFSFGYSKEVNLFLENPELNLLELVSSSDALFEIENRYSRIHQKHRLSTATTFETIRNQKIPDIIDLDRNLISKRTDISALKLDPQILEELSLQYCHCIGIGTEKNQIRAFAVALIEELKLDSNANIKTNIIERLKQKKSFTIFQFEKEYKIPSKVKKFIKVLEEIYEIALRQLDQISDYKNIFLDSDYVANNKF